MLTKKNVKDVLGKVCSSCVSGIDATKFDTDILKKAAEDCDKCN
ncbi:MAG: hypothetical protein WDO71_23195 [Bacteroidota bacterium]